MGKPLKKVFTKDITVHCFEKGEEEPISSKLTKQVGARTYLSTNSYRITLGDKETVEKDKKNNTGYVVVTDTSDSSEHSLFKLTKNTIVCTDGKSYPFKYSFVYDGGTISRIKQGVDAPARIEGLFVPSASYTYTINPRPADATVTLTAEGYTQVGNSITVPEGTEVSWGVSHPDWGVGRWGTKVVNATETEDISLYAIYTVDPTPADATVTLLSDGYTQVGNSITVHYGAFVTWSVSKEGYVTQSNNLNVFEDTTNEVVLQGLTCTFTINPTPSDSTVELTASGATQVDNSITVPYGTTVAWSVSREAYLTKTGTETVKSDNTKDVTLESAGQAIDVTGYEYTNENQNLVLTKYIGEGGAIAIPNLGE